MRRRRGNRPRGCRASAAPLLALHRRPFVQTMVETPRAALTTNAVYRNARWAIRGLGGELLTNLAGRGGPPWTRVFGGRRAPEHGGGAVAVVTGATGGIGSEIASGLASAGYHVIVAARSRRRGHSWHSAARRDQFFGRIHSIGNRQSTSSVALARALGGRPCALLVNNAGVMSVGKAEIMQTNLIGPVVLTLALLPSLRAHKSPRVVNVGSSSHLRAAASTQACSPSPRRTRTFRRTRSQAWPDVILESIAQRAWRVAHRC